MTICSQNILARLLLKSDQKLVRYSVLVKFNKDFVEVSGNQIIVGIRSKPEKGKANEEVVKKIARHFKVAPSRVRICSGTRSRSKVIEIL